MGNSSSGRRVFQLILLVICCGPCASTFAQQSGAPPSPDVSETNTDQTPSLADLARKARKDHTNEVQMSDADAKKLFESVDKILEFAADDTGFQKRASVKRRLIGANDVEQYTREQEAKQEIAQRVATAEMTMKKFGFIPRDFNLREFLVKANGKQLAAYYDPENKTISMLNWIPLEQQAPILAHELTHALQDQNYGLKAFLKEPKAAHPSQEPEDDVPVAHRAVVEGQAQVVFVDFLLAPMGRNLQTTPGLLDQMEEPAVKATADSEFLHNAPMIMREAGTFPYKAGLIFEGELLQKGGKQMAFAGAFARPPRTTHEILQPKSYLEHEKLPAVHIPNMLPLLEGKYSVFDSGTIGELDVKALLEQYGQRRAADDLAASWRGGRYLTFQKSDADTRNPSTPDFALLYVSRWKSAPVAERFAHIYAAAVSGRYQTATPENPPSCTQAPCPVFSTQFSTEEGPVIVQLWPEDTVVVSESFDQATAAKLLNAAQEPPKEDSADTFSSDELGMRLYEVPGFFAFQAQIRESIVEQFITRIIK